MINRRQLFRFIRRMYYWARTDPVDEDLRGWSWDRPPIKPRAYFGLGVYEVAGKYCPTRRDVWLRRKAGTRPKPSKTMLVGRLLHEAIDKATKSVLRGVVQGKKAWEIYEENQSIDLNLKGVDDELKQLYINIYKSTLITILGELEYEALTTNSSLQIPLFTEYKVDGSLIGLSSNLSVDALANGIILDYKFGEGKDFHKLSIAGYALALESEYEIPFDYGLIIYISNRGERIRINARPVYVSNSLRRWFLEERDNIIEILLSDEEPPVDNKCKESCPFYKVCHP